MSSKQKWVAQPECKSKLALKIARSIMVAGDDGDNSCLRLQFMLGEWPDNEVAAGGLCEPALAKLIETTLNNHFNNMTRRSSDAEAHF